MDLEHWSFSLREAKTQGHVQNGKRLQVLNKKRLAILPWLRSSSSGGPMPRCRSDRADLAPPGAQRTARV
jgi:hypothetical protein